MFSYCVNQYMKEQSEILDENKKTGLESNEGHGVNHLMRVIDIFKNFGDLENYFAFIRESWVHSSMKMPAKTNLWRHL